MSTRCRKEFNFSSYKQRYIALKILYFGWDYDGLSAQITTQNTIEHDLFQALIKTRLVESREKCGYNRCGRTDKGVSAYGQVVNLKIRSNLVDENHQQNIGLFTPDGYLPPTDQSSQDVRPEINYIDSLNRVLPSHIKVMAWAPVSKNFSSRFSCKGRSYSYIFPKGDLCIESMKRALSYLVGEHDFRNLCSFDLKNGVHNHRRTISSAFVSPLESIEGSDMDKSKSQYLFYQAVIVGKAFLYHQIRCIMSILFLVGLKKESPEVVRDLLDMSKCPARPNYSLADPMPLCLFDCNYDPDEIPLGWKTTRESNLLLIKQLKSLWLSYKTKASMIEKVLFDLQSKVEIDNESSNMTGDSSHSSNRWRDFGLICDTMSDAKYIPLLKRPRDQTLEEKLEAAQKKKRENSTDPNLSSLV